MQKIFDKIIERFRSEVNYNDGAEIGLKQSIEIVNQAAEQYNNGWIPCSERLPEQTIPFQTAEYTVTMRFVKGNRKSRPFTSHANFDYESGKWMIKEFEVIAWREQIEPYQPKGE